MTKAECKRAIQSFKFVAENYRRTLLNRDNIYSDIAQANLIDTLSSQLNQTYGKFEKYINEFGDGVGVSCITAFGSDEYPKRFKATSFVIQGLDRIIGRLDGMSEKEFEAVLALKKGSYNTASHTSTQSTIHDIKNPHGQYWTMLGKSVLDWFKENKIVSGIFVAVAAGLLIFYIQNRLGG